MERKISRLALFSLVFLLSGCGNMEKDTLEQPVGNGSEAADAVVEEKVELKTYSWDDATVYEAEDGRLLGGAKLGSAAGVSFVEGLANEEDGFEITIHIDETNFYDLSIYSKSDGNYKENYVLVDGESLGNVVTESKEYANSILSRVYMEAGDHIVAVKKNWGWIQIDSIKVKLSDELDPTRFDMEPVLVNPNASDNAKRLMTYLCDIYGKDILSGQNCDQGAFGEENAVIWKTTGKYPALLGLDLIEYSPSRVAHGSSSEAVEYAIDYWEKGGIVTFCWHWNAPTEYITGTWYSAFYKEHTNIDLEKIMNGKDQKGYDLLMADIDAIAVQLQRLEDAGVPILWRPLHEASGGWFWWGDAGADAYKKLYVLLYDRLTKEYGLDNLIWVWNGQDKDWYPGDEYVDIIGEDIYPGEKVYAPQTAKFLEAMEYTDAKKMIILSENGCMFDPDLAIRDGAMWGSFCTWGGEFVSKGGAVYRFSEQYTEEYMLKKVYEHEHVITRDELPDIKNYPLR